MPSSAATVWRGHPRVARPHSPSRNGSTRQRCATDRAIFLGFLSPTPVAVVSIVAARSTDTVVEADPAGVPASPDQAWESWQRRGVAQFRQPHNLVARFRQVCGEEMPDMIERLLAAGCVWLDPLAALPPTLTDREPRPGDDALRFPIGRRPTTPTYSAPCWRPSPAWRCRRT